jgi:hypothetical protein
VPQQLFAGEEEGGGEEEDEEDDDDDEEEEYEEKKSSPKPRRSKRKRRAKRQKKRSRDIDVVDDHQEAEHLGGSHVSRITWNPFQDYLDDGEIRFPKTKKFADIEVSILMCPGEIIHSFDIHLSWITVFSPFGSDRDSKKHRARYIASDSQYEHGGTTKPFLDYEIYREATRRNVVKNQEPFVERHTYNVAFNSFGIHNKALRASETGQECQPGELFVCFTAAIDNRRDGSRILYRAFSRGIHILSSSNDKHVPWKETPREEEERLYIKPPARSPVLPVQAVSPRKVQRRKIFEEASVVSYVGNLEWAKGGAVCVTFSENAYPPPREQLLDIKFGVFDPIHFQWDSANTIIFFPISIKSKLWENFCGNGSDSKSIIASIKSFIDRGVRNGCLTITLSYATTDDPNKRIIKDLFIPFSYPLKGMPDEAWQTFGEILLK